MTTNDRVARIEQAYISTQRTLAKGTHTCTADESGRCRFCPEMVIPALATGARTGELK